MNRECVAGEALKEWGQEKAAHAYRESLHIARQIARNLSICNPTGITVDAVRLEFLCLHPRLEWGNFAGLIFKGKDWRCLGFAKSKIISRRGGTQRVWVFEPNSEKEKSK